MPYKKPLIWEVRNSDQGRALTLRAMPGRMARQRPTRMSCPAGCGAS